MDEQRLLEAVRVAMEGFWGSISSSYPDAKMVAEGGRLGMMNPRVVVRLFQANMSAVRLWVAVNEVPEPLITPGGGNHDNNQHHPTDR